jgi:glycogen debranching enzyme
MSRSLLRAGVLLRTDDKGDIIGGNDGLYTADTRHLSRWELSVDGGPLVLLGAGLLVPPLRRGVDPPCTLAREQTVHGGGLTERITVHNHLDRSVEVTLGWAVESDFADLFDVRAGRPSRAAPTRHGQTFEYRREDFHRQTVIRTALPPVPAATGDDVTVVVPVGPLESATVAVDVVLGDAGIEPPRMAAEDADLESLLIPSPTHPGDVVIAAGAPWFLTLFGRDSLLTSLFAIDRYPWLAASTLRSLAALQGREVDPGRAEEPGKILHEWRVGELSHFGDVPFGRYYGTVDATPLFLMLLVRLPALAGELEGAARAAVEWMFRFGGLDRTGYLVYRTDGPGLVHQCWKDSPRGICFRSGEPALGELAVCEVQGYAHAALLGVAGLAEAVWDDPAYAARLRGAAAALRRRFHDDFVMGDFVALARTTGGRRVDAHSSNPGHLLWTGMLEPELGALVGRRLAGPEFFSGWGIRTLAAGQPAYHPVSYHNGSVWPHDTAITVAGLMRYGLRAEADRVAAGLRALRACSGGRLPEVLTGFGRDEQPVPVPYPHSCSPQAWAAAAPLLIAGTALAR